MTTCRDVITYALRMTKVIASGDNPSNDEAQDGLIALQSMYDHWVANAMFGRLEDTFLASSDTAEEGKRYFLDTGAVLTFPATYSAQESDEGERQPRDLSLVESLTAAGVRTVKLYDRTAWVDLLGLTLSSDAPLAGRGAFGLAACLAVSGGYAAMFGSIADIGPTTVRLASQFSGSISGKQGSTRDKATAEYY